MKKIILYSLIIISIIGCDKKVDWPLQGGNTNLVIVDGTITDEDTIQSIKLSFPVTQLNAVPTPVSGATVVVSNNDSTYVFKENPANSGIYQHKFKGTTDETYTLMINYNNDIFSAKTNMLPKILISQPIKPIKDSNDSLYHISVSNSYDAKNFAMYEILLDWSKNNSMNPDSSARLLYYTLPTIDINEIFVPGSQTVYFPARTIITERRYSITREHAEYIRALLLETNWQGGLFDSEHANLPTNLSAGAGGFFATCGVSVIKVQI